MATYTENYSLILPEEEDLYDVNDYNKNFNAIDAELTALTETVETLSAAPASVIKSIQRVTFAPERETTSGSVSIQPVNPSKCFVILEHLQDNISSAGLQKIDYTLNATSISITHASATPLTRLYGFWIIEFN